MNSMAAFYYLYPHKLLAKKFATALSELRELGDAAQQHLLEEQRWATREAELLARIGDLTDDLTQSIEREPEVGEFDYDRWAEEEARMGHADG